MLHLLLRGRRGVTSRRPRSGRVCWVWTGGNLILDEALSVSPHVLHSLASLIFSLMFATPALDLLSPDLLNLLYSHHPSQHSHVRTFKQVLLSLSQCPRLTSPYIRTGLLLQFDNTLTLFSCSFHKVRLLKKRTKLRGGLTN